MEVVEEKVISLEMLPGDMIQIRSHDGKYTVELIVDGLVEKFISKKSRAIASASLLDYLEYYMEYYGK